MGRTPDYMNVTFAGFAGRADEWAINCNERGAQNLVSYQRKHCGPLLEKYLKGVGADAEQRSRVFRLAWDFAATALGSRNEQYERVYLGSVGRNLATLQVNGDRTRANRLLDRFLSEELETGPGAIRPVLTQAAK